MLGRAVDGHTDGMAVVGWGEGRTVGSCVGEGVSEVSTSAKTFILEGVKLSTRSLNAVRNVMSALSSKRTSGLSASCMLYRRQSKNIVRK